MIEQMQKFEGFESGKGVELMIIMISRRNAVFVFGIFCYVLESSNCWCVVCNYWANVYFHEYWLQNW